MSYVSKSVRITTTFSAVEHCSCRRLLGVACQVRVEPKAVAALVHFTPHFPSRILYLPFVLGIYIKSLSVHTH
jgi:hypothetical protein